ncbi:MAG: hypothetical protein F6K55_38875, partial [Moorea sp. SIO4A3]|nr:hypothetical protein [Moorena sp. SIO4A3]
PWLLALGSYLLPLTLVVRYGADYLNPGYKVEDEGKSAPNAPYWTDTFKMVQRRVGWVEE